MGIDYYYCRKCRQSYADCDKEVRTCEFCKEDICEDCLENNIDISKVKYFKNSDVATENSEENILKEFCPLCTPKIKKVLER